MVRTDNHQVAGDPPSRLATFFMKISESFKIGRVEARIMMTTTNIASVKSTLWLI